MDTSKIGRFIAELRKEKGVTQQQLADNLFVTREAVSKWERGVNSPEVTTLVMMSTFLNVSVNEIIAGERITEENKEEIENIALSVLSFTKTKISKIRSISIMVVLTLLLIFLGFYFISNYNSLRVYILGAESKRFDLTQGIIVTSKQKSYISLGNIISKTDAEIDHVELYYEYDKQKTSLITTDDINNLEIDLNSYNEMIRKKKFSNVLENLHLDVHTKDDVETMHLESRLDYTNKYIVPKMFAKGNKIKTETKVPKAPKLILDKFDYIDDRFILKFKDKGIEYECIYDGDESISIVVEEKGYIVNYDLKSSIIKVVVNKQISEFSYDSNKCIKGKCKDYKNIINAFKENVLN